MSTTTDWIGAIGTIGAFGLLWWEKRMKRIDPYGVREIELSDDEHRSLLYISNNIQDTSGFWHNKEGKEYNPSKMTGHDFIKLVRVLYADGFLLHEKHKSHSCDIWNISAKGKAYITYHKKKKES